MDAGTQSVGQRLISHVASVSGLDAAILKPDTSLFELGLDSILLAIILRGVEVEFEIEFGDDEVANFLSAYTIGDYIGIVETALGRQTLAQAAAAPLA
jgi:acyl carrier protein